MLTADFDDGYPIPFSCDSSLVGSLVTASEPMPLPTLTTTGAVDRSSSGMNAFITRTMPKTFVSNTSRTYPNDRELAELVRDLLALSPRFADLWTRSEVTVHVSARKRIEHPEVGSLELDCDVLTVQGADLRIVAYSAEAGTPDAAALDLLRVIGVATR